MLDADVKTVGIACGPHKALRVMCDLVQAGGFVERQAEQRYLAASVAGYLAADNLGSDIQMSSSSRPSTQAENPRSFFSCRRASFA